MLYRYILHVLKYREQEQRLKERTGPTPIVVENTQSMLSPSVAKVSFRVLYITVLINLHLVNHNPLFFPKDFPVLRYHAKTSA